MHIFCLFFLLFLYIYFKLCFNDYQNFPLIGINAYFDLLSQVKQSYLIAPHELHFQLVHHILKEHIMQTPDYKVNTFAVSEFE